MPFPFQMTLAVRGLGYAVGNSGGKETNYLQLEIICSSPSRFLRRRQAYMAHKNKVIPNTAAMVDAIITAVREDSAELLGEFTGILPISVSLVEGVPWRGYVVEATVTVMEAVAVTFPMTAALGPLVLPVLGPLIVLVV